MVLHRLNSIPGWSKPGNSLDIEVVSYGRGRLPAQPREQMVNSLIGIVTGNSRSPTHLVHFDPNRDSNTTLSIPWERRRLLLETRISGAQYLAAYFESPVGAEANGILFTRARQLFHISVFVDRKDPIAYGGLLEIEDAALSTYQLLTDHSCEQLVLVGCEVVIPWQCKTIAGVLDWALSPVSRVLVAVTDQIIDDASIRGFECDSWVQPFVYRRYSC